MVVVDVCNSGMILLIGNFETYIIDIPVFPSIERAERWYKVRF